jgi:perosamine synthetase
LPEEASEHKLAFMEISFHLAYIAEDEINGVVEAVRSGWLTMVPKTIEFERRLGDYVFEGNGIPA